MRAAFAHPVYVTVAALFLAGWAGVLTGNLVWWRSAGAKVAFERTSMLGAVTVLAVPCSVLRIAYFAVICLQAIVAPSAMACLEVGRASWGVTQTGGGLHHTVVSSGALAVLHDAFYPIMYLLISAVYLYWRDIAHAFRVNFSILLRQRFLSKLSLFVWCAANCVFAVAFLGATLVATRAVPPAHREAQKDVTEDSSGPEQQGRRTARFFAAILLFVGALVHATLFAVFGIQLTRLPDVEHLMEKVKIMTSVIVPILATFTIAVFPAVLGAYGRVFPAPYQPAIFLASSTLLHGAELSVIWYVRSTLQYGDGGLRRRYTRWLKHRTKHWWAKYCCHKERRRRASVVALRSVKVFRRSRAPDPSVESANGDAPTPAATPGRTRGGFARHPLEELMSPLFAPNRDNAPAERRADHLGAVGVGDEDSALHDGTPLAPRRRRRSILELHRQFVQRVGAGLGFEPATPLSPATGRRDSIDGGIFVEPPTGRMHMAAAAAAGAAGVGAVPGKGRGARRGRPGGAAIGAGGRPVVSPGIGGGIARGGGVGGGAGSALEMELFSPRPEDAMRAQDDMAAAAEREAMRIQRVLETCSSDDLHDGTDDNDYSTDPDDPDWQPRDRAEVIERRKRRRRREKRRREARHRARRQEHQMRAVDPAELPGLPGGGASGPATKRRGSVLDFLFAPQRAPRSSEPRRLSSATPAEKEEDRRRARRRRRNRKIRRDARERQQQRQLERAYASDFASTGQSQGQGKHLSATAKWASKRRSKRRSKERALKRAQQVKDMGTSQQQQQQQRERHEANLRPPAHGVDLVGGGVSSSRSAVGDRRHGEAQPHYQADDEAGGVFGVDAADRAEDDLYTSGEDSEYDDDICSCCWCCCWFWVRLLPKPLQPSWMAKYSSSTARRVGDLETGQPVRLTGERLTYRDIDPALRPTMGRRFHEFFAVRHRHIPWSPASSLAAASNVSDDEDYIYQQELKQGLQPRGSFARASEDEGVATPASPHRQSRYRVHSAHSPVRRRGEPLRNPLELATASGSDVESGGSNTSRPNSAQRRSTGGRRGEGKSRPPFRHTGPPRATRHPVTASDRFTANKRTAVPQSSEQERGSAVITQRHHQLSPHQKGHKGDASGRPHRHMDHGAQNSGMVLMNGHHQQPSIHRFSHGRDESTQGPAALRKPESRRETSKTRGARGHAGPTNGSLMRMNSKEALYARPPPPKFAPGHRGSGVFCPSELGNAPLGGRGGDSMAGDSFAFRGVPPPAAADRGSAGQVRDANSSLILNQRLSLQRPSEEGEELRAVPFPLEQEDEKAAEYPGDHMDGDEVHIVRQHSSNSAKSKWRPDSGRIPVGVLVQEHERGELATPIESRTRSHSGPSPLPDRDQASSRADSGGAPPLPDPSIDPGFMRTSDVSMHQSRNDFPMPIGQEAGVLGQHRLRFAVGERPSDLGRERSSCAEETRRVLRRFSSHGGDSFAPTSMDAHSALGRQDSERRRRSLSKAERVLGVVAGPFRPLLFRQRSRSAEDYEVRRFHGYDDIPSDTYRRFQLRAAATARLLEESSHSVDPPLLNWTGSSSSASQHSLALGSEPHRAPRQPERATSAHTHRPDLASSSAGERRQDATVTSSQPPRDDAAEKRRSASPRRRNALGAQSLVGDQRQRQQQRQSPIQEQSTEFMSQGQDGIAHRHAMPDRDTHRNHGQPRPGPPRQPATAAVNTRVGAEDHPPGATAADIFALHADELLGFRDSAGSPFRPQRMTPEPSMSSRMRVDDLSWDQVVKAHARLSESDMRAPLAMATPPLHARRAHIHRHEQRHQIPSAAALASTSGTAILGTVSAPGSPPGATTSTSAPLLQPDDAVATRVVKSAPRHGEGDLLDLGAARGAQPGVAANADATTRASPHGQHRSESHTRSALKTSSAYQSQPRRVSPTRVHFTSDNDRGGVAATAAAGTARRPTSARPLRQSIVNVLPRRNKGGRKRSPKRKSTRAQSAKRPSVTKSMFSGLGVSSKKPVPAYNSRAVAALPAVTLSAIGALSGAKAHPRAGQHEPFSPPPPLQEPPKVSESSESLVSLSRVPPPPTSTPPSQRVQDTKKPVREREVDVRHVAEPAAANGAAALARTPITYTTAPAAADDLGPLESGTTTEAMTRSPQRSDASTVSSPSVHLSGVYDGTAERLNQWIKDPLSVEVALEQEESARAAAPQSASHTASQRPQPHGGLASVLYGDAQRRDSGDSVYETFGFRRVSSTTASPTALARPAWGGSGSSKQSGEAASPSPAPTVPVTAAAPSLEQDGAGRNDSAAASGRGHRRFPAKAPPAPPPNAAVHWSEPTRKLHQQRRQRMEQRWAKTVSSGSLEFSPPVPPPAAAAAPAPAASRIQQRLSEQAQHRPPPAPPVAAEGADTSAPSTTGSRAPLPRRMSGPLVSVDHNTRRKLPTHTAAKGVSPTALAAKAQVQARQQANGGHNRPAAALPPPSPDSLAISPSRDARHRFANRLQRQPQHHLRGRSGGAPHHRLRSIEDMHAQQRNLRQLTATLPGGSAEDTRTGAPREFSAAATAHSQRHTQPQPPPRLHPPSEHTTHSPPRMHHSQQGKRNLSSSTLASTAATAAASAAPTRQTRSPQNGSRAAPGQEADRDTFESIESTSSDTSTSHAWV